MFGDVTLGCATTANHVVAGTTDERDLLDG